MEEQLPAIKAAVVGVNRENYKNMPHGKKKLAAETVCIFYADGTAEIVDFDSTLSIAEKEQEVNSLISEIQNSIKNPKKYEVLFSDSKDFQKIITKAEKIIENKPSALKKAAIGTGLVAGGAAIALGASALVDKLNDKDDEKKIEADNVQKKVKTVPDMEGKDLAFYTENALENSQKTAILNIADWVSQNGKESWERVTFTDEELENLKKAYPNLSFEGNEALFGFTAEDAYSLVLRYSQLTNDEYVTLTGGNNIDTVAIMDDAHSMSNGALANIISYYVCSDTCDLNIEELINFSEKETAKIDEIEGMLAEYKTLANDGKDKEAEAKMQEMKSWLNNYANSVDYEQDNAKSYILRTFVPTCSIISQMNQYKDTITINLYDTQKDGYVTKDIKTDLFDEIMMRTLVMGFEETAETDAFDASAFLKEHNISSSRYVLKVTDVASSIADQSCSSQSAKLEEANEYISTLRTENSTAEAAYIGSIHINLNDDNIGDQVVEQMDNYHTQYDDLTYGTYSPELLLEMVNNHLKDNDLYPKNVNYFRTAKIAEMQIAYKDQHGITSGKKGDIIKETKQEDVNIDNVNLDASNVTVLDQSGNVTTPEQAKEEARENTAAITGIPDASTPEASQKADEQAQQSAAARINMLQGVYNATFNHYNGGAVVVDGFDTSNTYGQTFTEAWATSSDADIVSRYNAGKADGEKYKADSLQNGKEVGGEENIYPEFENAETYNIPQAPVVNPTPTPEPTPEPVVPEVPTTSPSTPSENQPSNSSGTATSNGSQTIDPEFEGAEIYDTPQTPVPSVDNTTKTVTEETNINENNEGFSNQAPENFAPVVDPSTIDTSTSGEITYFDIANYLNTEEGNQWFEELTSSISTEDVNEMSGPTK